MSARGSTGLPDLVHRGWAAFTRWRHARPFWGGLFLVLAAAELLLSSNLNPMRMQVHVGPIGFLSYVIPFMLALCGALAWASPAQRVFYGIVGAGVAVYSLIGLNLGGFFVGVILGMVGGALAAAWRPAAPVRHEMDGAEDTEAEQAEAEAEAAEPADGQPQEKAASARLDDLMDAGNPGRPVQPWWSQRRPGKRQRGRATLSVLLVGAVLTVAPVVAPHRSEAAVPAPIASPRVVASVRAATTPTAARTTTAATPSALAPVRAGTRKAAAPLDQPPVNRAASRMLAARLTMSGMSYDGVVEVPTARGTVRSLLFTMRRSVATPFELRVAGDADRATITSDALTVAGSVRFYTSRFSGKLFGLVPVTFTPDAPPLLTLPDIVFTSVDIDLVYVHADTLTAARLRIVQGR